MRQITCFIFSYFLLHESIAFADNSTTEARTQLKNYGLANCITAQFSTDSDIKSDINLAIGAYSPIGKGKYIIEQNEDTFEIIHDPYTETEHFFSNAYKNSRSLLKSSGKQNAFDSCMEIYNSEKLDLFINTQDKYISRDAG